MADIGGIMSKIEGNVDKIGAVIGVMSGLREHAWGKDVWSGLNIVVNGLVKDPHFPDLSHVRFHMMYPGNNTLKNSLAIIVSGYLLEAIDVDRRLERFGRALQKGGWGALLGDVVLQLLIYSGAGRSEILGANHGLGGGSHVSFKSGSAWNPHGHYSEESVAPYGTNLTRAGAGSPSPYT